MRPWVIRDFLFNVGLYAPLGFFAFLAWRRQGRIAAFAGASLYGVLLSLAVEILQFFDVSRYPSGLDVIANGIGSVLGAAVGVSLRRVPHSRLRRMDEWFGRDAAAAVLLLLWVASLLYPFVPVDSLAVAGQRWKVFRGAGIPLLTLFGSAAAWMGAGCLWLSVSPRIGTRWLTGSLLLLPASFFLQARQPVPAEWLGAGTGVLVAAAFGRSRRMVSVLAPLFLLSILAAGLAADSLKPLPVAFGWLPFHASLSGDWHRALGVLLNKAFLYGTSIWLLAQVYPRLLPCTLLTAGLLAGVEFAQLGIPGRTPEVTDPLLALLMGRAIFGLRVLGSRR